MGGIDQGGFSGHGLGYAQKRNTHLQKIIPVVYKYMLNLLKKFCVTRKYFDAVQKLKIVTINITNFCQNVAP